MLNRRSFLTRSGVALIAAPIAASSCVLLTGCSDAWITTAINDLPVAISIAQSIASIVTIATGAALITPAVSAVISTAQSAINAGLVSLKAALDAYNTSKSPTTLGKITDTLNELLTDLPNLLPTLTFADVATKTAITTGISLLIAALSSIQILIPPTATALGSRRALPHYAAANASLSKKTKVPAADQIKSQFNAVVSLYGYPQVVIN